MNTGIELVFFLYGLAFFSMGLVLLLESGRSPLLVEGRVLRPLAFFGLVHGFHEWYELYIMSDGWMPDNYPGLVSWIRLALLVISFSLLITFGVQVLFTSQQNLHLNVIVPIGMVVLFAVIVFLDQQYDPHHPGEALDHADVAARFLLGVTGASLASLALALQGHRARLLHIKELALVLWIAAGSFIIYGLTQTIVAPHDFFPSNLYNTASFLRITGIPIQVVRAVMAITITLCLIRAVQVVDDDRRRRFGKAQQDRLSTLEQLRQELEARERLRQDLMRHIVFAQEAERTRIARELHDETAQLLTAFNLHLASLRDCVGANSQVAGHIGQLKSISDQMAQSVYRMVRDLRPAQLDDLGLVPALEFLKEEMLRNFHLRVNIVVSGQRQRLDDLVETVIFRVAQEGVVNAARHANVDEVKILITFAEKGIHLEVQDQGKGFDLAKVLSSKGAFGLTGMRERVEAVNGVFEIITSPGKGCQIIVDIPLVENQPTNRASTFGTIEEENMLGVKPDLVDL